MTDLNNDYIISVVSYKRPNNNTCKLLLETKLNWNVFVYAFDPFIEEYKKNYGEHVREITEFEKASLPRKRQLVLDSAMLQEYTYCIMLDDDILNISLRDEEVTLQQALIYMLNSMFANPRYVALSAAYNKSDNDNFITKYKNICNNSIFNLPIYKESGVRYNPDSKCEDMEFTIDLLLRNYLTGKLEKLIIKNDLQGGTTNDGLSYRFAGNNRFIEEGTYMSNKYKFMADVFEYDENHFKMNSSKLVKYLKEDKDEN